MDHGQGSTIYVHVAIVFDWKMMAVFVSVYLIRLLIKEPAGLAVSTPAGP